MHFFAQIPQKMKSLQQPLGIAVGICLILLSALASAQTSSDTALRLKTQATPYVEGEVLVKLKSTSSMSTFSQKLSAKSGTMGAASFSIQRSWSGINMHRMRVQKDMTTQQSIEYLKTLPEVEFVEPNYYVNKQSVSFDAQSVQSLSEARMEAVSVNAASTASYYQSDAPIEVTRTWDVLSSNRDPVVVAVIDSGVDYTHDIFVDSNAIWRNTNEVDGNGIDDDGNGYIDDVRGWNFVARNNNPMDDSNHGTHVAGIIFGISQDILATQLQPATIKIMPLKFLDSQGRGTTSDAISAIMYAVNNGARVLNNSWGGAGFSQSLKDAINFAYQRDRLFVAAAGNASTNNDVQATYPASYIFPNVVSIAASNDYDRLAGFSNYGKQTVHVASPGQSIFSTLPGNSMGFMSGTSMAAPLVSGLTALMLRENPSITAYQLRSIVSATSNQSTYLQNKTATGARINVFEAVSFAQTGDPAQFESHPIVPTQRAPSSESSSSGGCAAAVVSALGSSLPPSEGPQSLFRFFGFLLLILSPLLILNVMKNYVKLTAPQRRKFDRYLVDTQVRIAVGGRELQGAVKCISVGGARIDTNALLERGGTVKLQIVSPGGQGTIEVDGHVVWSEQEKSYGVQFDNIGDRVRNTIRRWQSNLIKI